MLDWLSQINNWVTSHNDSLSAWASLITVISVPLILIGLFLGYHQIRDILVSPDPSLEFVHPSSLAYKIVNKSGKIAEDVLVSFGIFDLDSPQSGPLAIPSVNYDYVNPELCTESAPRPIARLGLKDPPTSRVRVSLLASSLLGEPRRARGPLNSLNSRT